MKTVAFFAFFAAGIVVAAEPLVISRGPDWIPLKVENEVMEGSALDFSFLSENAPTGRLPRVVARGSHFEFEDSPGVPRRFFGVNICGDANFADPERAEAFVRQLRLRGYNSLRLHHHDNGLVKGSDDGTTINPEKLDRIDAFVAACARNGIYVTTDLFVSRMVPRRVIGQDRDGSIPYEEFKELVLVNEAAYSNLCAFARAWMSHVNPYTSHRWADDPAVAFIAVVNEGHIGIGGLEKLNRHPEYVAAWEEYAERNGLDYAEIPAGKPWDKTDAMAAAMPFLAELEGRFLARMRAFLKDELGVKALLADMSAGMENEAYRPVRAAFCDYVDEHWYWDHPSFPGKSWSYPSVAHNQNPVRARGASAMDLCSDVRVEGRPFVATEYCFSGPNPFRHAGGLIAGAQAAREDWAALWHFDWAVNEPTLDRLDETGARWFELSGDPLAMAADRATMSLFLRGDIGAGAGGILASSDVATAPSPSRDDGGGVATSARAGSPRSGSVAFDQSVGSLSITTPRTAGGFAEGGALDCGSVKFSILPPHRPAARGSGEAAPLAGSATVFAISLDGLPLRESRRILVSHLTDLCNEGQTFEDATRRVLLSWGRPPHLVRAGRAEISIGLDPGADFAVWALDTAGRRVREVPHSRDASGRLVFTADVAADPESATFLYEIEREVQRKIDNLPLRAGMSPRPVLVYDGHLSPSVEGSGYFDAVIPAGRLLGF